jgi:hypothetical protein
VPLFLKRRCDRTQARYRAAFAAEATLDPLASASPPGGGGAMYSSHTHVCSGESREGNIQQGGAHMTSPPEGYVAFALIGTTFRELGWKTLIFFERVVPVSPSACVR